MITVSNAGPSSATQIRLTNTIPAELVGPEATASQGSLQFQMNRLEWHVGTIFAGGSAHVEVQERSFSTGNIDVTLGSSHLGWLAGICCSGHMNKVTGVGSGPEFTPKFIRTRPTLF